MKYVQASLEDTSKHLQSIGFPVWRAEGALDFYMDIENRNPAKDRRNFSDIETITGEKPTALKAFVQSVAPNFK